MIILADALHSLAPNSEWETDSVVVTAWKSTDIPQPSQEEIDAEVIRLQAEHDAQAYARNRQAEYPSIDQLTVALWEGVVEERMASVTRLEGLRQAVKTRYPK